MLLKRRDAYQRSLRIIEEAPLETDEFAGQAQLLCQACLNQTGASGCTLYLQPGREESGFRRAAQAGTAAEETGPGVVRDLLTQAWDTGQRAKSQSNGRWFLAFPVWPGHTGGGALIAAWDTKKEPGDAECSLMENGALVASLIAPRFAREGALSAAHDKIQQLQVEVAEESHLAGVGRLASGVAHELSTPLTAVLTMVGSLARTIQDPIGARRLRIIQDAVEKCRGIIEKLLLYSQEAPAEDQVTFSRFVRASTNINKVIENVVELVRESYMESKIAIETDLKPIPEISANSSQWSSALQNLLEDCRLSLSEDSVQSPKVRIAVREENQAIRIEISDNRPEIAEEDLAHIFEPFSSGTSGADLSLAQAVVQKHQGTISVSSDAARTAFVIEIPVEEAG